MSSSKAVIAKGANTHAFSAQRTVPTSAKDTAILGQIRFAPEQEKLEEIMTQFELDKCLSQFERSGEMSSFRQQLLATQVRFSETLSPRLFGLLKEVKETLQFPAPVELFVAANPMINAFAIHAMDGSPYAVSLTSSLVEKMDDGELRFVLGHELGHLAYQHYRAQLAYPAVGVDEKGASRMPVLLRRRLGRWARMSELSADRAGCAATKGELNAVVSAFFKMECGLGPEHVNFDISAFLGQLDEMQKAGRGTTFCGFSHPLTPIRVRALQLFSQSGGLEANGTELQKVNTAVSELAQFMDFQVTGKLDINGRDLILGGGVIVAHADQQNISNEEMNLLIDMLLPLMEDPAEELSKVQSIAQAEEMVSRSATWLRENAGQEKFNMFGMLAHIAAVDGRLEGNEESVLLRIAQQLGIPDGVARETIVDILGSYIREHQANIGPIQKLR